MEENERKSFMFYLSWLDCINEMEPDELKRFISNLCNYHLGLDVVLITKDDRKNWNFVKPALETNDKKWRKRAESSRCNGQLGGAPVGNQNASKSKTTQNNPNNLLSVNSKMLTGNSKMVNDKSKLVNENSQESIDNSELVTENCQLINDNSQEIIVDSKLENENLELEIENNVIPVIEVSKTKSTIDSISSAINCEETFDMVKYQEYVEELLAIKENQYQSNSKLNSKEIFSKLIASMYPQKDEQFNILRYILQTKNYNTELVNIILYYSQNYPVELKRLFDKFLPSMPRLLKKDLAALKNIQFQQICFERDIQLKDYLV